MARPGLPRPTSSSACRTSRFRALTRRLLLGLVLLLASSSCTPGASPAEAPDNCFPLRAGARWTFDGLHRGRVYRYTIAARPLLVEGRSVFAFYDLSDGPTGRTLQGNMFADELFRRDGDQIRVADEHQPASEHLLLQFPLRERSSTEYRVGPRTTRVTVESRDQQSVPAGTFDCFRLSVVNAYENGRTERHTVWLAPGVGMVRWQRASGRVDELVHFASGE